MPDPIPLRPGFKEWWAISGQDIYAALVAVHEGTHPDEVWERLNENVRKKYVPPREYVPDEHGNLIDVTPLCGPR